MYRENLLIQHIQIGWNLETRKQISQNTKKTKIPFFPPREPVYMCRGKTIVLNTCFTMCCILLLNYIFTSLHFSLSISYSNSLHLCSLVFLFFIFFYLFLLVFFLSSSFLLLPISLFLLLILTLLFVLTPLGHICSFLNGTLCIVIPLQTQSVRTVWSLADLAPPTGSLTRRTDTQVKFSTILLQTNAMHNCKKNCSAQGDVFFRLLKY